MRMTSKIEFAVKMSCSSCVSAIENSLDNIPGIQKVDVNIDQGSVVVDTTLAATDVLKHLEKSGLKVVLKGLVGTLSAVVILDTGKRDIQGVVRFAQINPDTCIVDGTIDGLKPGECGIFIHETGDLSQGCNSVGDCFNPYADVKPETDYGNLGCITVGEDSRATFSFENNVVKLQDVIGRSVVVTEKWDKMKTNLGSRLVCGIIARASGLFENPKTICACDGVSIWDERDNPKKSSL